MWEKLKAEQKEKYRTLITNFASLSEAFSQKSETDEENETFNYVAQLLIPNSKKQSFREPFMQLVRTLPTLL